ncbi:MAG: formyltetrahydrofolate deformylase [Gammaproteobacteria bacterium]|nr:formyltetrahydrofolate deformylase [Gammaproteobacteria bacterium]
MIEEGYILTATCPGNFGIVAAVSGFLADRRCYILEMAEFDDLDSGRFFVRSVFKPDPEKTPTLSQLREEFEPVAASFAMEWTIHHPAYRARVLLLVSKYDHCLNDLLYRYRTGDLKMEIPMIVSNHPDLEPLARWHDVPFTYLPVTPETKQKQEERIMEVIEETKIDLVVLARYMQILSDSMCSKLEGRAINIHHSFLPGFKGAKPYHQAFKRGVKLIGATAHYVTAELDEGPIIEQVVERVDHTYNPERLVSAGRDMESLALARAVKLHIEYRVFRNGNKTVVFR